MPKMPERPKYVTTDLDRHGNERIYARRDGTKVRLRGPLFSDEFWTDYKQWLSGALKAKPSKLIQWKAGSFGRAVADFYRSSDFLTDSDRTRYVKRLRLDNICMRPAKDGRSRFGDAPIRYVLPRHIREILNDKAAVPNGANNDLKALKSFFKWARSMSLVDRDPCVEISPLKTPAGGFHPWTPAEREAFRERHPIGTKARLALELFLLTGVRRSDAVKLGRPHLRQTDTGEKLQFTVTKGSHKNRVVLTLPVLPALRRVLDASKDVMGDLVFLQTEFGKPYSVNGFGAWFKRRCEEAGLPHCTAHGLRKLAATTMAENKATAHQLMSVFGWTKIAQAEIYTKAASQAELAESAMALMSDERTGHNSVPPGSAVTRGGTKAASKSLK